MSGQPLRRAEIVRVRDKELQHYTAAQRAHYRSLARAAFIRGTDNDDNRQKAAWAARTLR